MVRSQIIICDWYSSISILDFFFFLLVVAVWSFNLNIIYIFIELCKGFQGKSNDIILSFSCSCPSGYNGPRCQQTARSFRGSGWAWYPPLDMCDNSHLSLEFITRKADGMLLYNGPIVPPETDEVLVSGNSLFSDFVASLYLCPDLYIIYGPIVGNIWFYFFSLNLLQLEISIVTHRAYLGFWTSSLF